MFLSRRRFAAGAAAVALAPGLALAQGGTHPKVQFVTNLGSFTVQLDPEAAPKTVTNFLQYVQDGFYDGTIFHRVIANFMIQGGGYDADYGRKPTRAPVVNEARSALQHGLRNTRGTIAMARTADPDSATGQFFINVVDNPSLDPDTGSPGYTVFGTVVQGMDTVDQIRAVPTGSGGPFPRDVPQRVVRIESARVLPS